MGIENTIYVAFFVFATLPYVAMRSIEEKEPVQEIPDLNTLPIPPTFTHEPNDPVIYYIIDGGLFGRSNLKERTFTCTARGYPTVSYYWEKDGRPFNLTSHPKRITQFKDEGSFIFSKLQAEDEGTYQCFAVNGNGTAVDRPIEFKRTWIARFPPSGPVIVHVELQDPVIRHCNPPDSVPDAKVYWILMSKDEQMQVVFTTINSTYISSDDQGNLYFHSVLEEHIHQDADYACTAENSPLEDYKFGQHFRLNALKNIRNKSVDYLPPREQFISKDVVAVKGRSISLHCFFSGFPPPNPQWYKGDMPLKEKRSIVFGNFGKSLEIRNVSVGDAGEYKCKYRNASTLNRMIKVQVESAPYWSSEPPASVNSSEGQTVSFVCGAGGVPQPQITLFKNGKEINPSPGDEKFEIVGNQLVINNLERGENGQGDNAVYQCKAENKHGYVWANFYLNVFRFPPILLHHTPVAEAILTKSLTLSCTFFGSPLPHVTWEVPAFSDLVKIQEVQIDHRGVARLRIEEVVAAAVGNYSCRASNMFGEAMGYMIVSAREATRIVKHPKNITTIAGQPVALECQAASDPNLVATYSWLVDGEPLPQDLVDNGHYLIDSENTFHIKHARIFDSASYTCKASTSLDHVSTTAYLEIKDVPNPVASGYINCDGEGLSAAVHFKHIENENVVAHVEEFWVQYRIDNAASWRTHSTKFKKPWGSALRKHHEVNLREIFAAFMIPLRPYGRYKFRVFARNEVYVYKAYSAPMEISETCETSSAAPEINPTDVRTEANIDDTLLVYWEPLPREEWHGPNFHYVFKYRSKDVSSEEWSQVIVDDPYSDHVTVSEAGTWLPYEVQVQAVNAMGPSAVVPETINGFSGQGIPAVAPNGFRLLSKSGTSCTFAWNPVNQSALNGEFKGYKVIHWHNEAIGKNEVEFSPNVNQGTVHNMKPYAQNMAQILVFNGANDGPPSDTITIAMPEGVPTSVRSLKAFPLAHNKVSLSWKPPRELNGELIHYLISYCPILGKEIEDRTNCSNSNVDADTEFVYIEGLSEETSYRFTMMGVTRAGEGVPNSIDATTLPNDSNQEPPVSPTLTVTGIADDHLNVTWHPGAFDEENPQPVGDAHYFKYREIYSDEWQEVHPTEHSFTDTIDGLEPGTVYELVAVSVVNGTDGNLLETQSYPYMYRTAEQDHLSFL